jgi:hypothetical protein
MVKNGGYSFPHHYYQYHPFPSSCSFPDDDEQRGLLACLADGVVTYVQINSNMPFN